MYYVYIIRSEKDLSLYIGSCGDITDRLARHNRGASRYTKSKRPWKLEYTEKYKTKREALKREKYLKSLKSKETLEYLIENGKLAWE